MMTSKQNTSSTLVVKSHYVRLKDKAIIIADRDLDGLVSALIVSHRYLEPIRKFSSAQDLVKTLKTLNLLDQGTDFDLFILDIGLNMSQFPFLQKLFGKLKGRGVKVFYLSGHHEDKNLLSMIETRTIFVANTDYRSVSKAVQTHFGTSETEKLVFWGMLSDKDRIPKNVFQTIQKDVRALQIAFRASPTDESFIEYVAAKLGTDWKASQDPEVLTRCDTALKRAEKTLFQLSDKVIRICKKPPILIVVSPQTEETYLDAGFVASLLAGQMKCITIVLYEKKEDFENYWMKTAQNPKVQLDNRKILDILRHVGGDGGGHSPKGRLSGWLPKTHLGTFLSKLQQLDPQHKDLPERLKSIRIIKPSFL